MSAESFTQVGAVDLSGLAQARKVAAGGSSPDEPAGGVVVEVNEASFETEVLTRSMTVPVVIDFWAEWCEPCKQLSPVLEKLAAEYGGRFVLAKIDVDANQRLAASAQVQSIPMVLGVVRGRAVPLFAGALPEAEVRKVIDELLKVAVANGLSGRAEPAGESPQEEPEEEGDPRYDAAFEAISRGDLEAADAAYRGILEQSPGDAGALAGLAQVGLMKRVSSLDEGAVRAAAADPRDVAAALDLADLEMARGDVDAAFGRLVETVRRSLGEEREVARTRLVELFEVVGPDDPRVARARSALASALF